METNLKTYASEEYVQNQIMTEDKVNQLIAAALANIRNGEEVSY